MCATSATPTGYGAGEMLRRLQARPSERSVLSEPHRAGHSDLPLKKPTRNMVGTKPQLTRNVVIFWSSPGRKIIPKKREAARMLFSFIGVAPLIYPMTRSSRWVPKTYGLCVHTSLAKRPSEEPDLLSQRGCRYAACGSTPLSLAVSIRV